jgi:large-conductance mechanosensitive channel
MVLNNSVFNKVLDLKKSVGTDLKSFIFNNNILGTMSAVTIAFSTGTMIRSLTGELILPSIYSIFNSSTEGFKGLTGLNVSNFMKEFISWLIVILITFVFIDYILKKFIWTPDTKKEEPKKEEPKKEESKKVESKKEEPKKENNSINAIEEFNGSYYSLY